MNEIMEINARILEAEEQGQAADFETLLTEDFFIVRSTGQNSITRRSWRTCRSKAPGRQAVQPEVHQYKDCAIYTCIVTTSQNPGRFWNTRLFVLEDGHWRSAAWQVTEVSDG